MDAREWAGTTATRYDLHRFTLDGRARCNSAVWTPAWTTDPARVAHPWQRLRTREEIEAEAREWAGRLEYRFCPECDGTGENEED